MAEPIEMPFAIRAVELGFKNLDFF